MLVLLIIARVLFIASIIFIIGYIFGGFSKKPVLKTLSRIAAILVIVAFIFMNISIGRGGRYHRGWCPMDHAGHSEWNNHINNRPIQDSIKS